MKKLIVAGFAIATLGWTSCTDEDSWPKGQFTCTDGIQNGNETSVDCGGSCAPCEWTVGEVPQDEDLSGLLTEDFTLTSDIIWEINGKFVVSNGATLTIESGTIIKEREGSGFLSSANFSTSLVKVAISVVIWCGLNEVASRRVTLS